MSAPRSVRRHHRGSDRRGGAGVALVICLLLLLVLSVLAVSGATTAVLEQRMAGNTVHLAQAFEAAEAGLAQAMAADTFPTDAAATVGQFAASQAGRPVPLRGSGAQIDGCANAGPDAEDRCEYFVRFDAAGGITPLPADPAHRACHFEVESFGVAGRGARTALSAGFYVIGPADCAGELAGPPVRTYWREQGID